jgi:prepilin-type N-terminal cleavage/methylation domain-containing protein
MKKNDGFSLIELIGVIVLIAIIVLIAVPIVINILDTSKTKAAEDSALMAVKAVEDAYLLYNLQVEQGLEPSLKGINDAEGKPKKLPVYFELSSNNVGPEGTELFKQIVSKGETFDDYSFAVVDGKVTNAEMVINGIKVRVAFDETVVITKKHEQDMLSVAQTAIDKFEDAYALHNQEINNGQTPTIDLPEGDRNPWYQDTRIIKNVAEFTPTTSDIVYINSGIIPVYKVLFTQLGDDFIKIVLNNYDQFKLINLQMIDGQVVGGYMYINGVSIYVDDGEVTLEAPEYGTY